MCICSLSEHILWCIIKRHANAQDHVRALQSYLLLSKVSDRFLLDPLSLLDPKSRNMAYLTCRGGVCIRVTSSSRS